VTFGASRSYFHFCNFYRNHVTESECLLLTLDQLLVTLGLGLSVCAAIYAAASFFERALSDRRIRWKDFCSELRDDLSRE
jgi:hypothetical protein